MLTFRRLPLDNIRNCRDLVGIPTQSKRALKGHRVIRSGNINRASADDVAFLKGYGISHIIDLRTLGDIAEDDQMVGKEDFQVHSVNLLGQERPPKKDQLIPQVQPETAEKLRGLYDIYIHSYQALREIFELLLSHPDEGFLYHCGIGKDRTGIVTMMILAVCQVDLMDIMADYELSKTYLRTDLSQQDYGFPEHILNANPSNIQYAYQEVISEFGSFDQYFLDLGFSQADLADLRQSLLVGGPL